MREREPDDTDVCRLCGEEIHPADPTSYPLSDFSALCYQCAKRCGGAYDAGAERWKVAPKLPRSLTVDDLAD
jgi:hypothetical protein